MADVAVTVEQTQRWIVDGCWEEVVLFDVLKDCKTVDEAKKLCFAYVQQQPGQAVYKTAVGCLCLFVRDNVSGPPGNDLDASNPCLASAEANSCIFKNHLNLMYDVACVNARNPFYLVLSKWLLFDHAAVCKDFPGYSVWAIRLLKAWQYLFTSRQNALHMAFKEVFTSFDHFERSLRVFDKDVQAMAWFEVSDVCNYYYRFEESMKAIEKGMDLLQLSHRLTGVLGRRTRFQTFDCAQLVVQVDRNGRDEPEFSNEPTVPKSVNLKDDTLLEQPKLSMDFDPGIQSFSSAEQCALLAVARYSKCSSPTSCLKKDELLAYLRKVIDQQSVWSVQSAALFLRCQMEKDERRRVERALEQLTEQVDGFLDDSVKVESRWKCIFTSCLPPIWIRESCLAEVLISLGVYSAALEIFLKLKQWNDVIECYKRMNMLTAAEKLIRELNAEEESPVLLCYLGDVTGDEKAYEKAWEISGCSYAPAQRCLGVLKIRQHKYEEAKRTLDKALALQPLDVSGWFNFGYCCLKLSKFDEAKVAYQRVVMIDPNYAEAWSNWALASMRLGEYETAYQVLQDALKCSYDNMKIWNNFITSSCLAKHFPATIMGINHILDRGNHFDDMDLISRMTESYVQNENGVQGTLPHGFDVELRKLLGRLTSKYPDQVSLWRSYATLCDPRRSKNAHPTLQDTEKYVDLCEKAHRTAMLNKRWLSDAELRCQVLQWTQNLLDAYRLLATQFSAEDRKFIIHIESAKSVGDTVLKYLHQAVEDSIIDDSSCSLYLALKEQVAGLPVTSVSE